MTRPWSRTSSRRPQARVRLTAWWRRFPSNRPRKTSDGLIGLGNADKSCPGFAPAKYAHHATADFQLSRTGERDIAGVGFSVIGIIDSAGPFALRYRLHALEYVDSDNRAVRQRRILIL